MAFNQETAVFGAEFDPSGIVKGANAVVESLKKTANAQEQVNTAMAEGETANAQYAASTKKVNDALNVVNATQKKVQTQFDKPIAPTVDLAQMNAVTAKLNKFKDSFKGKLSLALDTTPLDILTKKIIEAKSSGGFKDIASIVDTLSEKLIELEPGTAAFEDLSKAVAAGNTVLKEYNTLLNQATKETEDNSTQTKSLKTRIKEYREELTRLEDAGQEETEHYRQTQLAAAKLTDQYGDMQQQIRILASDTKNLDFALGVIQAVGAGFQAVAGGLELFGVSSKDAEAAQTKLLAIMSLVQGVQQLQNLLLKESVIRTVGADLASKAYAATQRVLAITLGATAAASKTLQAALIATGVGALVVGLGFLIAKIIELNKATDLAVKKQEEFARSIAISGDRIEVAYLKIDHANDLRLESLKQQGASEAAIYESNQKAIRDKIVANNEEISLLQGKALQTALQTDEEGKKNSEEIAKQIDKLKFDSIKFQLDLEKNAAAEETRIVKKRIEDNKLYAKEQNDINKELLNDRQRQILDLRFGYEQQKADQQRAFQDTTKLTQKYQVDKRELQKKFDKEDVEERKRIINDLEKADIDAATKRIENIQNEFQRRQQEIKNNARKEREDLQESQTVFLDKLSDDLREGIITPQIYAESVAQLNAIYDRLFEEVNAKIINETSKLNADIFQRVISDLQRTLSFAATNISTVATAEIVKLSEAYVAGTVNYAKYQKELTRILDAESKLRLNATKEELEQAISLLSGRIHGKVSAEEKKALEEQRNELLGQLSATNRELASINADNQKKQEDLEKAAFQRKLDSWQAFAKTVVSILNSVADADQRNLDRSIAYQEKRVAYAQQIAENGNAEYLELEQKRLDELQRRREAAAEKQIAINNALVASEALVAVISAIAANAGTGFGVFAVLPAIFGAIAAGYSFVSSLNPSPISQFYEGTRFVDGPGGRDQVPAMLTRGEGVMPVEQNQKYSGALDAIYNQSIPAEAFNRFAAAYPNMDIPMVNYDRLGTAMDIVVATSLSKNNETLERIATLLEDQEPVKIDSKMDAEGFSLAVTKYNRKSRLRGRA